MLLSYFLLPTFWCIVKLIFFLYLKISRFEDIIRDQLVCVSTGREFIPAELRNKEIEIKANWNRVRKVDGLDATNIKINSKRNPIVDVDPFAPPVLTLHKQNTVSKPLALPPSSQTDKTATKTVEPTEKRQTKSAIVKTNSVFKKNETESESPKTSVIENKKESSRPKTASKTKPKRRKSKSSSPKRVQISNDPIDVPKKDQIETENGQNGSFSAKVVNRDVGSSIEFSFNTTKNNMNKNLKDDDNDIDDDVEPNFEDENVFEILD